MFKKIVLLLCLTGSLNTVFSQIIYSERFNTLTTLTTGSYTANSTIQNYLYGNPSNLFTINNGDLVVDTLSGNYPFKAAGQKQKAWLAYKPSNLADTFAVSSSWLNPTGTASAFLITPTMSVAANSLLSWQAMAPDVTNADGYEVYVSVNTTTTPVVSDFTALMFSTSAEKNTWQNHSISLEAFKGQNIRIAFKNNSTDKYQLWIDDIIVENITNAFDASIVAQDVYKYASIGDNNSITATIKNNGFTPINNLTINYQFANEAPVSEIKILSPALNYLETQSVSFSIPYQASITGYKPFKIWTSKINNNQTDVNSLNDSINGSITILTEVPAKKILIEQFTSTNCGWCPDNYSTLKALATTYSTTVITAALHQSDNLATAETNALTADYAPTFPSAMIDRYYFSGNQSNVITSPNWNTYLTQRMAMKVPATVTTTATFNQLNNQITATISASFVGDVKGDYRLNLYVKENNIYGPSTDLTDNQWNQYNFSHNISSSPYYQLGSYLNASTYLLNATEYKHQYTINKMLDGAYGVAAIIPTNGITSGQTYTKIYTYTLPTAVNGEFRFNTDNVYLIGVLSEYNADTKYRTILNAYEKKLTENTETVIGIKELTATDIQLNVFPNPTTDICQLSYTLKNQAFVKVSVYNTLGELVYIETKQVNAGNVIHDLSLQALNSGNYSIQVTFNNTSITKKLTIIK